MRVRLPQSATVTSAACERRLDPMSETFIPYALRLRKLARDQPDKAAFVMLSGAGSESYTFLEYDRAVDRFATAMRHLGVDSDTAVFLAAPNSAPAVIAASAAWRLGAFVAAVGSQFPAHDLSELVEQALTLKRSAVVFSDHVRPPEHIPCHSLEALRNQRDLERLDTELSYPARAAPSGGTTGRPKLILDRNPWGYATGPGGLSLINAREAKSALIYSPLYHSAGQTLTHMIMLNGATVYLMDRFDARLAQTYIREHKIEFLFAVPTHLQRFLELPDLDIAAFGSVRTMYHSGAYCPPSLKKRWLNFFGPERVWEVFGASEAYGYTRIRGDEWLVHEGSVGQPYYTDIRIQDEDGRPVPAGEVGLIFMKPQGADIKATDKVYLGGSLEVSADGYATVGDMGWLDSRGYLFIADRRTDLIISGGVNIFPAEVESALLKVPGIRSAAVIGVPDEKWGRRVHAVIVRQDGSRQTSEQIQDRLKDLLSPIKRPKSYEFRTDLPLTEVGKIDRKRLLQEHEPQANASSK